MATEPDAAAQISDTWIPRGREAIALRISRLLRDADVDGCLGVSPPSHATPHWTVYLLHGYQAGPATAALRLVPGVTAVDDSDIWHGFLHFDLDDGEFLASTEQPANVPPDDPPTTARPSE